VVITRGSVCWAELGPVRGSGPAKSRPVLVIQDDSYNASRLNTVIVATLTSNTALATIAGNVFVPAAVGGLQKDSVVNLTSVMTLDKSVVDEPIGHLPHHLMAEITAGLRLVLGLGT
jgi:mRNA interferase MazF